MHTLLPGKVLGFALLLFCSVRSSARDLTITIDGSQQKQQDTLYLFSDDEVTGTRLLQIRLVVIPGEVKTQVFKTDAARLLRLNNYFFLIGNNDSVVIAYNDITKNYYIAGGRYPGNYSIYEQVKAVSTPYKSYSKAIDNYDTYVKQVDSATAIRYNLLAQWSDKGSMSQDVFNYATAHIKHLHLYGLLYYRSSSSFQKQFPKSPGRYVSSFSVSDFQKGNFEPSLSRAMGAAMYVTTVARRADSANYRSYGIDYVINNFEGAFRAMLLHTLLVNFRQGEQLGKAKFQQVMEKINKLKLPENYLEPIRTTYMKQMVDGKPVDSMVMAGSKLRSADGKIVSYKQLQEQVSGGKDILIDFWASWCGPCIASLPAVAKMEKDYTVLYISLDTDINKWKTAAGKYLAGKQQFLLIDNYQSPLALYFLVSGIPRQVLLDKTGVVREVEYRLE